jgi:IS5 family transposase
VERQVSFADWELMRQGLRLEPLLQAISDFLDDQQDMIEQVRCDLTRGLKKAETGRSGLTPQQILRSLVLMRIKNWDYRELRERIADGCTLRQFTDFYCLPVPRHDAFHRGFTRLTSQTLKSINDLVVRAAVELELEDGQKLRVDTTVVQTDIHHPTDNVVVGCRSRCHALGRSPRRSAGTPTYQGFPRSDAIGAASDARDSTDDPKAAP